MSYETSFGAQRRFVDGHGVSLNLLSAGERERGQVVLFVHGYPDTHAVWLPVIGRLVDEFQCFAYDVRGAGASSAPQSVADYSLTHLVEDLVSVVDDVGGGSPVHVVGHDWGSVQAWEAVLRAGSDRRLRGRIASYTSISGPALGHLSAWVHSTGRRGRRGWQGRADLARQAMRSWYVGAFQVPVLPELALTAMLNAPVGLRRLLGVRHVGPTTPRDAVNGLGLYRANRHRSVEELAPLQTDVPVQVIVPLRDRFLTPAVYADLPLWCSDLTRHDIDAGHWVMRSHPDQVAEWIGDFVRAHRRDVTNL